MTDESPPLLDSALMYAALRGWRVHPLWWINEDGSCGCGNPKCSPHQHGKHPILKKWPNRASTDEKTIREWWRRYPKANIGLATGKGSGVWALDIDISKGKAGFDTVASLEAQYGSLPPTFVQRSGSGGEHRIFLWPAGGVGQTNEDLPGLDTRGEGGNIVLAPSPHYSGTPYEIIDGRPPVAAPDWLVSLFPTKDKKTRAHEATAAEVVWESEGHARAYVTRALQDEADQLSSMSSGSEKGRHGRFYSAVASIAELATAAGYPEPWVRKAMMDAAHACGLAEAEGDDLERTYRDAWAEGAANPRKASIAPAPAAARPVEPPKKTNGGGRPILDGEAAATAAEQTPQEDAIVDEDEAEILGGAVLDHFPGAPVQGKPTFPFTWGTNARQQLMRVIEKRDREGNVVSVEVKKKAPVPIFISSMDYEVNEGVYIAELCWPHKRAKQWRTCRVRRDVISKAATVPAIAAYGAPATSTNGQALVQWFSDYTEANLYSIPERRVSSRLGWHQRDREPAGFLFGDRWIGDRGWVVQMEPVGGLGQIAQAMQAVGDPATERAAVYSAMRYPSVAAVVGASLAAPLLRILKCPGFVVSLSGTTSTGKTSAMRVAAALWGDPDERESASVMQSWDATKRGIIEFATGMDGVPLLLDDTQRADSPYTVQAVLYGVPSGKGRLRASRTAGQTQQVNSSRTVLISSGEIPVLESSQHGGTRARVLEMWGEPWGQFDAKTGRLIREIGWDLAENHGNIGTAWIEYIMASRERWPEWRRRYRLLARDIGDQLMDRWGERYAAVTGRLAEYMAAIDAALKMAIKHGIIGAPPEAVSSVSEMFHRHAISEAVKKDTPAEALRYVWDISRSRLHEFVRSPEASGKDAPVRGWLGRWDEMGVNDVIYFYPARLREVLDGGGWTPEAVIRAWSARGWLDAEEGRNQRKVKILSRASWVVGINLAVPEVRGLLGMDP